MIPKSGNISASAIATFEECPAKFVAQYVKRTPSGPTNHAAMIGTADHYACQHFVNAVYFHKTHQWSDVDYLIELYNMGYDETFGTGNRNLPTYKDGLKLIKDWHARTELTDTILSTEVKEFFDLRPYGFEFNLTYILDRLDWRVLPDGTKELRVIDYKTEAKRVSPEEVKARIQPNVYAVAASIQYKEYQPDRVWVLLDMLRHDGLVGALWTREDLKDAWNYLLDVARRIYEMDENNAPYVLSPQGCRFCPIKFNCPEVQRNIDGGGSYAIHTTEDIETLIKLRTRLEGQIAANRGIADAVDEALKNHVQSTGKTTFITNEGKLVLSARGTRKISDTSRAAEIIGPDLMSKLGKLNVGDIDKLLSNDSPLSDAQKNSLQDLIYKDYGDEKIDVKPLTAVQKAKKK